MNQNQIQQLTSHLSQALDQNYDVVNMEAVLSVICALEGTTITKEQLEATRLAKYINQLRRRTKNDQLARRAKSLLKKWREMVGIHQQTSIDSQCQPADHSAFKPIVETDIAESNAIEVGLNPLQYTSQPLSPTLERVISNLHSNIDSSEPTNFSSLINNNIKIDNSDESMTVVNKLFIKQPKATEFKSQKQIFINEHSSNSVSTVFMANDKLNQASIVIDIVSDSDDNDVVNSKKNLAAEPSSSNYSRPKKLKKDKKCKDGRDKSSSFNFKGETSQQSSNSNRSSLHRSLVKESRTSNIYSTDPEILSLSNSSMSSILSGDAMSGNFQTRLHTPAADLTFAGRFKSVGQLEICSNLNSVPANGQKSIISNEPTSIELPTRPIYEYNNDSSTSCSRLSPYEELEAKQCLNPFTTCDETLPKKRGRKKGSKGVDSLIAKESSLSQQIFFGSGVKKVKTTKELFNDIQSRKLSISMNYGDNTIITPLAANRILNTTSTNRNLECQPLHTRPTSSCSETSIHSPHALEPISANIALPGTEKFSNTLENHGNTDSDTVTSEPSRDSKPRNMRIHSLDSNSNSLQQTPPAKNEENIGLKADYNDVTTQLVHIVRSLSNPLPVDEIEKRYQAEMVPCTCIIVEDMPKESFDRNKTSQTNMESDFLNRDLCGIEISGEKKPTDQTAMKKENCVVDAAEQTIVQKPMRSIFDLDFDDDDDPLQTIIQNIAPPESNVKATLDIHVDPTEANAVSSLADEYVNKDLKAVVSNSFSADQEYSNIIADPLNVYTVHEDPECIARKRFSVQTNDVTNFHINALHNYYIPNINGNWNSIDSSLVLTSSSITEFVQTLESYTVTDGSDVVPKYGSLTYEQRIRKDLSYLKFVQNYKPKSFKAFIPPFLGVAKCLPTCRLAAKRLKDNTKAVPIITSYNTFLKQEKSEMYCSYFENNRCSSNPLSVEVNTNNTDKSYENQARCSNDNPIDDNTALSYNLLKLANNNSEDPESKEKAYDLNTGSANIQLRRCRSNSTCSSSSFQLTQDSINEKPRNQGTKVTEKSAQSESNVERNRKKRRKSTRQSGESNDNIHHLSGENPLIKRIKISMNGNVEPHSQISVISSGNISSSDEDETHIEIDKEAYDTTGYCHSAQPVSDDEHESNRSHSTTVDSIMADEDDPMENDYDNNSDDEEYAIVQRPLAQGSGGNNHIVLTIKKTPSKINSPVNSISANSPIVGVASEAEILSGKQPESEITASYQRQLSLEQKAKPNAIQLTSMPDTYYNNFEKCYRYNHRHRFRHRHSHRQQICHKKTIDIELNHLFNNVSHSAQSVVKTHQKLFFTNELCRQDRSGRNERIVNYSSSSSSSSSSSYCNSSSNEDDYSETEERNHNAKQSEQCHIAFSNTYKLVNETDSIASVKSIAVNHGDHQDDDPQEHLYFYSSNESLINDDDDDVEEQLNDIKLNTINELPLENNGMLPSFNSIGPADYHQPNLTLAADLNGNDANISYTDDNLSVIQSHSLDCVSDASKMQYAINNITSNVMFKNSENDTQIMSQPTIEYRSGIRGVVDDSTGNKCCSRVQQFKEWHQVLQLQSYNNEPLIVLPYVVLE